MISLATIAEAQGARAGRADRGVEAKAGRAALLRGITLSAAEKAKLKEVQAKYRVDNKGRHESLRAAMTEMRAARQKGDTASARKVMERTRGEREQVRVSLERQRGELRAALSAEHQSQFDANIKQVAARRGEGKAGKHGARKHQRGTGITRA